MSDEQKPGPAEPIPPLPTSAAKKPVKSKRLVGAVCLLTVVGVGTLGALAFFKKAEPQPVQGVITQITADGEVPYLQANTVPAPPAPAAQEGSSLGSRLNKAIAEQTEAPAHAQQIPADEPTGLPFNNPPITEPTPPANTDIATLKARVEALERARETQERALIAVMDRLDRVGR